MTRPLRICVLSMSNGAVNRGVESWSIAFCRHVGALGHRCVLIQGGKQIVQDANFRTVSVGYEPPEVRDPDLSGFRAKLIKTLHLRKTQLMGRDRQVLI